MIVIKEEKYRSAVNLLCKLRHKENNCISIIAHCSSGYDYSLLKIVENFQVATFQGSMKMLNSILFLLRKQFEKANDNGKANTKSYSLRFIKSESFVKISLD